MGAAEAYDRHVGRHGAQLASGLVEVAGLRPGQRALDVGCGPGPLTRVLADRLGTDNVAAVDPSEPFVAACRSRVPGADVRVAVAEELPSTPTSSTQCSPSSSCSSWTTGQGGPRDGASLGPAASWPPASGTPARCHFCSRSGTRRSLWRRSRLALSTRAGASAIPGPTNSPSYGRRVRGRRRTLGRDLSGS